MLRHRVIPTVLLDGYSFIKTINFDIRRNLGNPITACRVYNNRNVDELILLDIDASKEKRGIDLHTIEMVSEHCFMPLTVGGGLRTCDDISNTLKAGADKVSLNSIIIENVDFVKEAVLTFGSQCIVASVDVKKNEKGEYILYSHSGIDIKHSLDDFLKLLVEFDVGEILLNNVDLDGKMTGFDLELICNVSDIVKKVPLIVIGGASCPEDFAKAVKSGASAVSAASIFHFTSITPNDCKRSMQDAGLPVRI